MTRLASSLLRLVVKYVLDRSERLREDRETGQSWLQEDLWKDLMNLEGHVMDLSLLRGVL
jgi:hypothetical protein